MKAKKITDSDVYALTSMIPRGMVGTYGEIAKALGKPKVSRLVGRYLHLNPHAPNVPCHRVVHSDGRIGGYATGAKKKEEMLLSEGVKVRNNLVVDFESVRFRDFSGAIAKV